MSIAQLKEELAEAHSRLIVLSSNNEKLKKERSSLIQRYAETGKIISHKNVCKPICDQLCDIPPCLHTLHSLMRKSCKVITTNFVLQYE